jgi:putative transposase
MTPQERAAVVEERRLQGYPLHGPPHPYREAGWYCITAANYEHVPVMAASKRRTSFENKLLSTMADIGAEVAGWVILPNHYHVLAGVEHLDQVSAGLKDVHGTTSRMWNVEDGLTGQRRVWYKFRDRVLRDERHYYRALNYIHFNAVKHGYVESPYDWPWCSLHRYFDALGREWLREKWVRYPVGRAWDFGDVG